MEKSTAIVLGISSLLIVLAIFTLIIVNNVSLSPEIQQETCNTIKYSSESATNLVFFSSQEDAKTYSNYLLETSPFNNHKDSFNVYSIQESPECELWKGLAIFCHSRSLVKQASSCPSDYIIVLKDEPEHIRSSAFLNVISINKNHPLNVLPHEFAHAFANLADEYTPSHLPSGIENCASSCDEFHGLENGCFQGCSANNYFRSIENGIMRTLHSREFGKFNENLIIKEIQPARTTITGNVISPSESCKGQFYHLIKANYLRGQISIKETSVEEGCLGSNGGQIFSYRILDSQGNKISSDLFNPQIVFMESQTASQQTIKGRGYDFEGDFFIKVESIQGSNKLEILNKQEELLSSIPLQEIHNNRPCKI